MTTKEAATSVYWDMYRCPVPSADVASRVGPFIKRALKNLGYSGRLTITAVGILTRVPTDILRAVYSSGVSLTYVDTEFWGIDTELASWKLDTEGLGNLMLLSSESSFRVILRLIDKAGHNIIHYLPFGPPGQDHWTPVPLHLWESFLASIPADPLDSGVLEEDPGWYCATCRLTGQGFEIFALHLKEDHVTNRGFADPMDSGVLEDRSTHLKEDHVSRESSLKRKRKQLKRKCNKQRT